ncbi:DNA polymerase III subunit delta' [Candidatus Protochlamydia amoebophila]|uniref:DNA-directed DNA polymerase n=1 Tax=Protochlamydia amoebophila (strain UWE25) TaxID=264201 RepID=Q6MCA3_PARUW|nr:DNA polymerase III subunit delta' [Candidatus Protochlamydia amoebophila]CAF23796.1 unnamed protein product [Candidatus Protochlamydia amoebophila UWE25]
MNKFPSSFSFLVGNDPIKIYLQRMLIKKAIGNSLLFAGPNGVGKGLFAYALASQLICEQEEKNKYKIENGLHPDIHIYRPEGKLGLHGIQSLRELSEEVHLPPYEASWKIFIIHDAERMLSVSANTLLKTFEEPPPKTVIILLSQSQAALLPTIVSRCRTLHFQPIHASEIEKVLVERMYLETEFAQNIASLSQGSLGRAVQLIQKKGDESRIFLLNTLSQLPLTSYKEFTQIVGELVAQIELSKKLFEEKAKEEFLKLFSEQLSTAHQQHLEKEIEGRCTQIFLQDVESLFDQLFAWYRDLHLLQLTQNKSLLIHSDYAESIEQILQRGNLLPLEIVQKSIEEARLSLQRSTSLNICLENLFLKLAWI